MMITNIFLPEKIRSYYLFSKTIVAITITKNQILAAVCNAHGDKRVLEKLIEQPILTSELDLESNIVNSLIKVKETIGKYDMIIGIYPSSNTIFKDITLPFTDLDKIKAVIPFEIEPLLPFNLDSGVIDSVITHKDTANNSSNILVAAAKASSLQDYINLFKNAGLNLDKITVNSLEIYSFFLEIPELKKLTGDTVLVNLGESETEIILLQDRKLKQIRTINRGISLQNYQEIFNNIEFTINSYIEDKANIVLCGNGIDEIPDISTLAETAFNAPIYQMHTKNIMYNDHIKSKVTLIPNKFLATLAGSLDLPITHNFNLQQLEPDVKANSLAYAQIISAIVLTLLPILSLGIFGYLHVKNLKSAAIRQESAAINELKKYFPIKPGMKTLDVANKAALTELNKQESTSHNLSEENRYALIRSLLEISKCLKLNESKLDISRLDIILGSDINTPNKIDLYGSVPEYMYLNQLQTQLQCPIFKPIGKLNELDFKTNPIELVMKE